MPSDSRTSHDVVIVTNPSLLPVEEDARLHSDSLAIEKAWNQWERLRCREGRGTRSASFKTMRSNEVRGTRERRKGRKEEASKEMDSCSLVTGCRHRTLLRRKGRRRGLGTRLGRPTRAHSTRLSFARLRSTRLGSIPPNQPAEGRSRPAAGRGGELAWNGSTASLDSSGRGLGLTRTLRWSAKRQISEWNCSCCSESETHRRRA